MKTIRCTSADELGRRFYTRHLLQPKLGNLVQSSSREWKEAIAELSAEEVAQVFAGLTAFTCMKDAS